MSDAYEIAQQRIEERARQLWEEAGSPEGGAHRFEAQAKAEIAEDEAKHDDTVDDSFPASDPPASSGVTGPTGDHPAVQPKDD
ncbi:DUF2934 domain-containing protein [Plastoroseomonas arctica]|uniref:DUF2934 domain-containing protein n=1 Tax=Plastoroseomonas arctica TaxID=1509237 RepID=A0AAF1KTA2_9PROT|nr:DUF2934 domain-containing protein [Plastoroseomonas arctica]MBR0655092.1 DUF2934 domain-containing protein [Plastoroseomonas arctica]